MPSIPMKIRNFAAVKKGLKFLRVCMFMAMAACASSKTMQKDKNTASDGKESLLVYISQGACMGKCPQYEAAFFSGKKMLYEGKKHMPLLGKYEFFVPDELVKNLIFEAVKKNVKTLPDSVPTPPDVPTTRIRVVINGKMKNITGWTGSNYEIFNDYARFLQTEVKALVSEQEGKKIP
jgi:hypothetical protein